MIFVPAVSDEVPQLSRPAKHREQSVLSGSSARPLRIAMHSRKELRRTPPYAGLAQTGFPLPHSNRSERKLKRLRGLEKPCARPSAATVHLPPAQFGVGENKKLRQTWRSLSASPAYAKMLAT